MSLKYYHEGLEGPLSENPTKLLIVLKEPHGENWNCFWMKDEVLEMKKYTKRYFNVLGAFACKILGESDKREALKKCAFINLYPYNGEATANNGGFEMLMKEWKDASTPQKSELLKNRINILKSALESNISIMTLPVIAKQIQKQFDLIKDDKGYTNNPTYYSYSCKNSDSKVYCICHRAYRRISYQKLGEDLGINI